LSISNGGIGGATITFNTGSKIEGAIIESGGGNSVASFTANSSYLDRWLQITFVNRSTADRELYVDGASVAVNTTSRTLPTISRVVVSALRYSGITQHGLCEISNAAVWDVVLTAAEISSLAAGVAPNKIRPANLVFYAPLENIGPGGGSGTTVNLVGPPVMLTNTVTQSTTQPRIYR
jgi:hypothetical protein